MPESIPPKWGDRIRMPAVMYARVMRFRRAHPTATALVGGIAIFAVIALLLTWPVGPLDNSHIPDGGQHDQGGGLWALAWMPYAISHGLNFFYTHYIDYPQGANLAQTPPEPFIGLIASPITETIGPVAAYNAITFLAYVSSAGTMYAVLHQWCRRWIPAFIGGLFFGFGPYMIMGGHSGGHTQFLFLAPIPAIVWCLYDLFIAQQHRPIRVGLLLGALVTAEAYITLEIVGDLAIVSGVAVFVALVLHRKMLFAKFAHLWRGAVAALIVVLPIVGWQVWWAGFGPGHVVGPTQPVWALQGDRADLFSAIVPLSNQLVAPPRFAQLAATWVGQNVTENGAYLGIPLVLLLVGFAIAFRKDLIIRIASGLVCVAYILSMGNRLNIGGTVTSIPLPEALLPKISLLDNTLPIRFALIVTVFAAIVLGVGIDRTWDRLRAISWPARNKVVAVIGASALVLVPLLPRAPLPSQPLAWPSSVQAAMHAVPKGSVVLTYPYPMPDFPDAQVWQAIDGMRVKLVGGYANVPEPDGSSSIEKPLLLNPPYVEEYFTESATGAYWFPPVGAPSTLPGTQARAQLCEFINLYSIGAVVAWPTGANPQGVIDYLISALGQPTYYPGPIYEWLHPGRTCTD